LEALRVYGKYAEETDDGRSIYASGDHSIQKAVIIRKPEPSFTEEARRNSVSGVVRLRAVLDADGKVRHILVLRGLPDGLSEMAVRAARKIEFRPAVRDGRPVSQYVILEYNFNVY
jgi:periplasmic protein TonB